MIYCFVRKITNSEYYGRYGSGVIGSERMYCNVRSVVLLCIMRLQCHMPLGILSCKNVTSTFFLETPIFSGVPEETADPAPRAIYFRGAEISPPLFNGVRDYKKW
jgi:hypothetical protein